MIIYSLWDKTTGRVQLECQAMTQDLIEINAKAMNMGYTIGTIGSGRVDPLTGIPISSSSLGLPDTKLLKVDETWNTKIPDNTEIYLNGILVSSTEKIIKFSFPGVYRLDFNPPVNYLPATCIVTVN